ncbi:MAG TPA: M20/M25/M40 family metallo-hydrolase [Terriglobales bacterium]|nr:M20/M25/M40 family metallo-hydrolase [Terriglobales bacterium]
MAEDVEARTIDFCRELVRLESPSGDERAVADAVEREMRALGYDGIERDELGSVVGIVRGSAPGATVLFDAHMDVVPATEPERWRFAPFSGERAEGRVWGRGATDVKGSLAALVLGVGALPRAETPGTILVSASVGEERIEGLALSAILERRPASAAVICEPTGLRLGLGHRGRASLVLEAEGRAAHTSRPENGVNAVYRLIEAIARVRAMRRPEDGLLGHGSSELVEISSEPFPGSSMVPYRAIARFDRRLVRGESRDGVLGELRAALAGLDGLSTRLNEGTLECYTGRSFRVPAFHPGWAVGPEAEIARRAARALADADLPRETFYAPYCTNGTATAGERGLPTLIYGAGEIGAAHAMDESVAEEQLLGALRGYQALARGLGR